MALKIYGFLIYCVIYIRNVYLQDYLVKRVDTKVYKALIMAFSAQTNCNQTQDIIMGKLDKRKKGKSIILSRSF